MSTGRLGYVQHPGSGFVFSLSVLFVISTLGFNPLLKDYFLFSKCFFYFLLLSLTALCGSFLTYLNIVACKYGISIHFTRAPHWFFRFLPNGGNVVPLLARLQSFSIRLRANCKVYKKNNVKDGQPYCGAQTYGEKGRGETSIATNEYFSCLINLLLPSTIYYSPRPKMSKNIAQKCPSVSMSSSWKVQMSCFANNSPKPHNVQFTITANRMRTNGIKWNLQLKSNEFCLSSNSL